MFFIIEKPEETTLIFSQNSGHNHINNEDPKNCKFAQWF